MVFRRKKTLGEIQDEIEYSDAELNLAQKRYVLKELKARSLTLEQVGGWRAAWQWLKTH